MKPVDFSHLRSFPGTTGNDFDVILRRFEGIQKIPAPLFVLLLLGLALIPTAQHWPTLTFILFGFFLSDWLQMALLPRLGVSFGPTKTPTLLLAILRSLFAWLPLPVALPFQIIGTLLVVWGFWIEPQHLTLTRQQIQSPLLQPDQTLRVLHLGDLHVERITARERRLNQQIATLKPDLILFSGDALNLSYLQDPTALAHARQIISEWQAPLGTFLVAGSEAVDLAQVFPSLVEDLPVRWLQNEQITLQKDAQSICLIGLTCTHRPFIDAPILARLVPTHHSQFTLLLYHSPDLAPQAAEMGIDLQLSGHTHGGQVKLPLLGALFTGSLYGRRFQSGRYTLGGLTLYITRGIGLEGKAAPRVRFLCPPEIILWEISGVK